MTIETGLVSGCPHCTTDAYLRRVESVYLEGTGTLSSSGAFVGVASGGGLAVGRSRSASVLRTDLAESLAPAPEISEISLGLRYFCAMLCLTFFGIPLALLILAIAAGVRHSEVSRVEKGKPAALAVWSTAWYCGRCDTVLVPQEHPDEDATVTTMNRPQFRAMIWRCGGYGDLQR